MSEPSQHRKLIEPSEWQKFLEDFAMRNNSRRARFDVFRADGTVEEESSEFHLENVSLKGGDGAKNVEIIRIDRSDTNAEKIKDVITNVRGISVQFDTDGSENILEITDDRNSLVSLRFESKVDGAS